MIDQLTILIPTFNDSARALVTELSRQAALISGLRYEIYVVDDGSTDERAIEENVSVNALPYCHFAQTPHHDCRSAMRNAMARFGQYEWCLMVDARLTSCDASFLHRYLESPVPVGGVAVGGVIVDGEANEQRLTRENLRFRYERHEQKRHSLTARRQQPYRSLRTTNFFFHRSVLQRVPYDERVKGYGYEDVLLGKALQTASIPILHIENPVAYTSFESNEAYINKVEEAMRTLSLFQKDLSGYSPLLSLAHGLTRWHLSLLVRLFHRVFGKMEKRLLTSRRPSLFVLKLYKLGFFMAMSETSEGSAASR